MLYELQISVLNTITIFPGGGGIPIGGFRQFTAVCRDQNYDVMICPSLTWNSDDTTIGTIDANTGLFTPLAGGTVTIRATSGTITGSTTITVLATGKLYITSNPSGARVYIDGIDMGVFTSVIIPNMAIGTYSYRLTLEGYQDIIGSFEIMAGQDTLIQVGNLSPINPGPLATIVVSPPIATVSIGGLQNLSTICKDQNGIVINCPEITWTVTDPTKGSIILYPPIVSFEAHASSGTTTVKATSGDIVGSSTVTLTEYYTDTGYGYLYVSSTPPGAQIYIDNIIQTIDTIPVTTPATIQGIYAGIPHTYKLTLTGYSDVTGTFNVVYGQASIIETVLTRLVPATEYLYISSTPFGSEVYIDDIDQKLMTPTIIPDLSPGTHTYKLTLSGYVDATGTFDIVAGQITPINMPMTEVPPPPSGGGAMILGLVGVASIGMMMTAKPKIPK